LQADPDVIGVSEAAEPNVLSTTAVFVSVFQLALAGGALFGGGAVDHLGLTSLMAIGGAIALAAAVAIGGFGQSLGRQTVQSGGLRWPRDFG
jgi:predicted MFS family arabinose efflux permease